MYINGNIVTTLIIFLPIAIIYLVFLAFVTPKLYKIGLDGKRNKECSNIYSGVIATEGNFRLCRGVILLTDKEIENAEAFSVSAPIRVIKYHKSSKTINFEFLYENENTLDIINNGSFGAYLMTENEEISILIQKITNK